MSDNISLVGQIAVVTGGGRGLGREIAGALARAGAKVAVTARSRDQLEETVAIITGAGHHCTAYAMDVTDKLQVNTAFAQIREQLGPVDLLVNNAGVTNLKLLPWEMDVDEWWHIMEVNLRGVILCTQAVLPEMIARKQGRTITIGSTAALRPSTHATAYAISKAAVMRLADSLAAATHEHGLSHFVISPGLVLTEMTRDVERFRDLPPSEWTPASVGADLCVLLASGQADKLSGRFIHATDDDVHDMIARADEIIAKDLNALRLHR